MQIENTGTSSTPGYPAQKVYEDRRIRLLEIQQEIKALLKAQ